jgi:hypothetical protein
VEVELHQLTLRYEHLRKRHPLQERALLTSLCAGARFLMEV